MLPAPAQSILDFAALDGQAYLSTKKILKIPLKGMVLG